MIRCSNEPSTIFRLMTTMELEDNVSIFDNNNLSIPVCVFTCILLLSLTKSSQVVSHPRFKRDAAPTPHLSLTHHSHPTSAAGRAHHSQSQRKPHIQPLTNTSVINLRNPTNLHLQLQGYEFTFTTGRRRYLPSRRKKAEGNNTAGGGILQPDFWWGCCCYCLV